MRKRKKRYHKVCRKNQAQNGALYGSVYLNSQTQDSVRYNQLYCNN